MNQSFKRLSKVIALLMALVMMMSVFAGCKLPDSTTGPITIESQENGTAPQSIETPLPSPTFTVSDTTEAAFHALDLEVFRWYVTQDGYSYHMFVDDPTVYQIDPASVKMTLGEFTEEDSVRVTQEATVYLDQLNAINREELKPDTQFSYDVLQQILTDDAEETHFEYFYEPLTEYSGLHSNMPLSFALFELKNVQDVEDYLTLLADMPRYMGQVLAYEQKRAELGMFMTEPALDAILEDIQLIIDAKDTTFLYVTFEEGIDKLTSLTPEQAQTYKDRNASLLKNEYLNSFQTLYDGLSDLRKSCRTYEEASQHTEIQKEYYEYSMQAGGCNSLTVEETLEMLKSELNYLLYDFVKISNDRPDIYDAEINLTSGDMQKDLDYLQTLIQPLLPVLPEHNLTLTDVPEELQDQFAPAAYVIPAMDDWKDNTIYINTATEDPTLLLTLAHEGYPGHMYQYIYQRSKDNLGLMQRAANFSGYAEGWAQFAEFLAVENQDQYDKELVRFYFDYGQIMNSILPAIISILVNYYGYTEEAVANAVSGYGFDGEYIAPIFYKTVVDQPYYFFDYAVGYSQLAQLYRDTKDELGDKFDMASFLKTYLDLGPGNFDLVKEQINVWSDGLLQDAA
ncbi:MAG TPA: DUF885 family protein [Clostridia bacterium]|nr:DUF885 family protein [Clostridia bacterium]